MEKINHNSDDVLRRYDESRYHLRDAALSSLTQATIIPGSVKCELVNNGRLLLKIADVNMPCVALSLWVYNVWMAGNSV